MNDVMLLAMMGVTSSKVLLAVEQQFRRVMSTSSLAEMKPLITKLPPEVLARLLTEALKGVMRTIQDSSGVRAHLTAIQADMTALDLARKTYLLALLDEYEKLARQLRDQCVERAAQGWPEWDYEQGCPAGQTPEATKPVDLGGLLTGIDLAWLDEPEEQEQTA